MNFDFRLWSARFLLGLGVLVVVVGAFTLNLTPIVAGAILLGLGHGTLAVHELNTNTKFLLGFARGLSRERSHEAPYLHLATDERNGPGLRDDPAGPLDPHPSGSRSARA